jgi:hypothetical protein
VVPMVAQVRGSARRLDSRSRSRKGWLVRSAWDVPRCLRLSWWGLLVVVVLAVTPGVAGAQGCLESDPSYTDACGPTFVLPSWGDGGGWTDESKYSTIQLADFNGDGRDELLARNDQGLEIWSFDTTLGQWRPQVGADDLPLTLTDFRSPLPNESPATDWTKAEYYSTIQTAHIGGNPGAQILARFADGMRVYYFNPGPGGSIDGGSWSLISQGGPFSDADGWNDPSRYLTIRAGDVDVSDPGGTELIGRSQSGLVGYNWNGAGWSPLAVSASGQDPVFSDARCGEPSCYALFRMARFGPGSGQTLVGRNGSGVQLERFDSSGAGAWKLLPGSGQSAAPADRIFADTAPSQDCAIAGFDLCVGSSPTYYATFGTGDVDGDKVDEVFMRYDDGLRVKKRDLATGTWTPLPTLTALAGAPDFIEELESALWGTIQTGDIDGDGAQDVLAVTLSGLQAWSYDTPSKSWQQLQPSTQLTLNGAWLDSYEYWGTIHNGDLDGNGVDDVIGRGPFGIRSWFYNRRGTGGWERYLPGGYQAFQGGHSGASGYENAFDAFNKVAGFDGVISKSESSVRDVWTQTNASSAGDLTNLRQSLTDLQNGILRFASCVDPPNPGTPLSYQSCARPSNAVLSSAGVPTNGAGAPIDDFDAVDWTWVVNETLAEIAMAQAVVDHFIDLEAMRAGAFESDTGKLAAIDADLQLAGAAGNTSTFNLDGTFAAAAGIGASIAGVIPGGEIVSAALWVGSELFSVLPSASPTATSTIQTTYAGLLDKLATAQDEMTKALSVQIQQVFGDGDLLDLVGQLRVRQTWNPNVAGVLSASRQAFVHETYQALMPTVFTRFVVSNCTTQEFSTGTLDCDLPTGPYVLGNSSMAGTWLGPSLSSDPCPPAGYYDTNCDYAQNPGTLPLALANKVWGPISDNCNYTSKATTLWTFDCSLGVPVRTTIAADSPGWSFPTRTGNPKINDYGSARAAALAVPGAVRASAGGSSSGARAAQAGSRARRKRDVLGPLRFSGRVGLSRALRLRRMRVAVDRTLFEHGRREELARSRSGRRLRPLALRHVRAGLFTSGRRGRPHVHLKLRRVDTHAARLDLRLTRVRTRDIRALCAVLPARVSRTSRPLELETRLRLRDRGLTAGIVMRQRWRCVRDRKGEFSGIRPIKPKRVAARPGLSVRLGRPRVRASGDRATVVATVTNRRRRRPSRVVSSLWDLRITGSVGDQVRTTRFEELRAGRSRTVRLSLPARRTARGKVCVRVAANATSARGASARRCARVAGAPRFTG